jgi:hypothetical protein
VIVKQINGNAQKKISKILLYFLDNNKLIIYKFSEIITKKLIVKLHNCNFIMIYLPNLR